MKAIDKERLLNIIKYRFKDEALIWEDDVKIIYGMYADNYFIEDGKIVKEDV